MGLPHRFGEIIVDGKQYRRDLIILPDKIIKDWWRNTSHNLAPNDITAVLEAKPEVFIVGTGSFGRMNVAPETKSILEKMSINLIALPTKKAVDYYNNYKDSQLTAAAFHLTC